MLDFDELEQLAQLVRNADIRELTLRQGDARITIRKRDAAGEPAASATAPSAQANDLSARVETPILHTGKARPVAGDKPEETLPALAWITAPLVGIFRSVDPNVKLGARVSAGQILGTIEAMKFKGAEIIADSEGEIVDMSVEDGMAVEYGQPLFAVKRSDS